MPPRAVALSLIACSVALTVRVDGVQARTPASGKAAKAGREGARAVDRRGPRGRSPRIRFGRTVGGLGSFTGITASAPAPGGGLPGLLAPILAPLAPPLTTAAPPAPAGATPTAPPASSTPVTTTGATTPATPAGPATLGIQVDETPAYTMVLSRQSVPSGSVRLQLQNAGEDPHNVLLAPADGSDGGVVLPLTDPGRTATRTVTLAPGTYRLFCTLITPVVHEAAGMRATLTVAG